MNNKRWKEETIQVPKTLHVGGDKGDFECIWDYFRFFLPRLKKSNSQESHFTFPNDIFGKSAGSESKSMQDFPIALENFPSGSRRLGDFFEIFLIFFQTRVGNHNFLLFRGARVDFCRNFCVFGKREVRRGKFCSCFGAAEDARERNPESVGDGWGIDFS